MLGAAVRCCALVVSSRLVAALATGRQKVRRKLARLFFFILFHHQAST